MGQATNSVPLPPNEAERLAELDAYEILDTLPEQAYDDITALAAQICGTPIALVSLIDRERQWFKSRVGLEVSETPRDQAFCSYAILDADSPLIVPDAAVDARFAHNPLVTGGPLIRFYAGAPLVTSAGNALGTLCVIDRRPRVLTADQLTAWGALARQVVSQLTLRRRLRDLSDEMDLRGRAEEARNEALAARSEFLARMSHEIRTPLHGVIGMVELLKQTALSEEQRSHTETLTASARALMATINDVLDFSKLQSHAVELEAIEFDLEQLASETIELVRPMALGKDLSFAIEYEPLTPKWFTGDRARLQQVLMNLLSNAVKFTSAGSVGVRVTSDPHTADRRLVELAVHDTGIGIAQEKIPLLFEPFVQADVSTTRHFGGTGLGLAISKQLVALMGGEIKVESSEGEGATFSVRIPLHEAVVSGGFVEHGPEASERGAVSSSHPAAMHVLVVDDNATNLEIARLMLLKLGHRVQTAADGYEAVEFSREQDFDLVLMDIHLPGLDGAAAMRSIRENSVRCPVAFAMTASATDDDRASYLRSGFQGVLPKPFTFDDLIRALGAAAESLQPPHEAIDSPIDMERFRMLHELTGNGARALVTTFAEEAWTRLSTMELAVANRNFNELRRAAHSLKGIAANLGAVGVARLAREIEDSAASDAPLPSEDSLRRAQTELRRFLEAAEASAA